MTFPLVTPEPSPEHVDIKWMWVDQQYSETYLVVRFRRKFSETANDGKNITKERTTSNVLFQSGVGRLHVNESVKESSVSHLLYSTSWNCANQIPIEFCQTTMRGGRFVAWLCEVTIFHFSPSSSSAFTYLTVLLPSVHQCYTAPTSLAFVPHAYQHDRCQYYYSQEFKSTLLNLKSPSI